MPDNPRRSARIAELTKKHRSSARVSKDFTIKRSKAQGRKASKRLKDTAQDGCSQQECAQAPLSYSNLARLDMETKHSYLPGDLLKVILPMRSLKLCSMLAVQMYP